MAIKQLEFFFLPGAISAETVEATEIRKNIRGLRNDMIRLNQLLHRERGYSETLEKDNILIENDFVTSLKVS